MGWLKRFRWEVVAAVAIGVALVAGLAETLHDEERARPVAVGEPAPPLTGETMTGEPFPAASLEGRVHLVSFWATWCTPCVEELPVL
ncbi:MAG: TlpA family protein disulfide reductase, partial [Myxococcales bacterium]